MEKSSRSSKSPFRTVKAYKKKKTIMYNNDELINNFDNDPGEGSNYTYNYRSIRGGGSYRTALIPMHTDIHLRL